MNLPSEIQQIIDDRQTGSTGLLNHLISALEQQLNESDMEREEFLELAGGVRKELAHFAVIENFLSELIARAAGDTSFPQKSSGFINEYRTYWSNSMVKMADHFLKCCRPDGKIILTHSHSETVISLFKELLNRGLYFRVLQTVSSPGEEGRVAFERMHELGLSVDLIVDAMIDDVLEEVDLIVTGCDVLLENEFLNKTGTRYILELAGHLKVPSILVAESRKKIADPDWKQHLAHSSLFEWVSLELVGKVVSEKV